MCALGIWRMCEKRKSAIRNFPIVNRRQTFTKTFLLLRLTREFVHFKLAMYFALLWPSLLSLFSRERTEQTMKIIERKCRVKKVAGAIVI